MIKELHPDGVIGTYDAAVVNKDEQGKPDALTTAAHGEEDELKGKLNG